MKAKIVCILVVTLMIATALPAVGTMNVIKEKQNESFFNKNQNLGQKSVQPLHDLEVEWERFYGDANDDVLRYIKQTSDGGYIGVGMWDEQSHWLLKVDANGDEEWSATTLPNPDLYPRCYIVEETSDGGFITAGCHEDPGVGVGYDKCIWKVDENGVTEWCKIYEDPLNGYHMCIQETDDGGFIVSGEEYVSLTDWDVFIMKTDSEGNVEWQKTHRFGEYGDNVYAVRQTDDGGYILSGRLESSESEADLLVIKTDSNGDIEWDKTYGGDRWEQCRQSDILFTDDGYLFLGATESYGEGRLDVWLIKTDKQGNMEWNKTYGGRKNDLGGAMDFTDDGGIIMSCVKNLNGIMTPKGEGLLIKTDIYGNIEWQHIFGYEKEDQFQGVCTTDDGGYIVAGNSDSTDTHGAGGMDAWLIKLKAFENNHPNKPDKPTGSTEGKPGENLTFSTGGSDPDGDDILFMWDWGDETFSDWMKTTELSHAWEDYGDYQIKVIAKDEHDAVSEWSETLKVSMPRPRFTNSARFNQIHNYFALFPILKMILQRLGVKN